MQNDNYFVPMVISQEGKNERSYDLYSRLLRDRIIFVPQINQETANLLTAQLLFLASDDKKAPIKMYINSPGGSILDGDGILDTMDFVKAQGTIIETMVIGKAASFGALILLNGTKDYRKVLPRSRVMIHQPRGGAQGTATDMEIEMKLMLNMKNEINEFVTAASGQSREWVEKHMERDSWFRGQEVVDAGLADVLVNN